MRKVVHIGDRIVALRDGGGLHGVVIPQQSVTAAQTLVGAFICKHRHEDLTSALTCANETANAARRSNE